MSLKKNDLYYVILDYRDLTYKRSFENNFSDQFTGYIAKLKIVNSDKKMKRLDYQWKYSWEMLTGPRRANQPKGADPWYFIQILNKQLVLPCCVVQEFGEQAKQQALCQKNL